MITDQLQSPNQTELQDHVLNSLKRYWPQNSRFVRELPIKRIPFPDVRGPLLLKEILLPDWAKQWAINDVLLVPKEACSKGENNWSGVDWWLAAFLLIECWHERVWEKKHGPIHSYSYRLKGWDSRVWERAWVNRIALFMREWASKIKGQQADQIFNSLPKENIILTHDVDAVSKTIPIRIKQGAFTLFNALKELSKLNIARSGKNLYKAMRFIFGKDDWWKLDELIGIEKKAGLKSIFHFYADPRPKNLKRWLFDPSYDINKNKIANFIKSINKDGFTIGLHPSFDSWDRDDIIAMQRDKLNGILAQPVTQCRQHWLKFSWENTWHSQEMAQLTLDTTLAFNDKSGFRNAAAISWKPWNLTKLNAIPTILMDSHLFDYNSLEEEEIDIHIENWLSEIKYVRGTAAILWHPHTITTDYGWGATFNLIIDKILK